MISLVDAITDVTMTAKDNLIGLRALLTWLDMGAETPMSTMLEMLTKPSDTWPKEVADRLVLLSYLEHSADAETVREFRMWSTLENWSLKRLCLERVNLAAIWLKTQLIVEFGEDVLKVQEGETT